MENPEPEKSRPRPRRYLLAIVLAAIAATLLIGGAYLLTLGGSPYYVLAGLAVGASSWFGLRGDDRAIWVYLAMLAATLLWALWETGLNPWGLQVRLLAPAVLGLWVAAPWLARLGWKILTAAALVVLVGGGVLLAVSARNEAGPASFPRLADGPGEWAHYGQNVGGSRFSPLAQINTANVADLKPAWTFRSGIVTGLGLNVTPIMVGDTLYICSPNSVIFALDAETGARRWVVDPKADASRISVCRGVSYFKASDDRTPCSSRIIFATADARLMAVDAQSGAACEEFGERGTVDLKHGMGEVWKGYYYPTSAPTIVNGKVIVGGLIIDGMFVGEPSGVIRAFDAVTGKLAWAWDMDRPGVTGEPPPGQTYSPGTANSWGPMSGSESLGLVYVPMGGSTPDYWGAHRSAASEKYGSSVVALDANTGVPRWHFQIVHHDVWDYDVSAQPTIIDLEINGEEVPALIQTSKRGQVFLLDRRNGRPLARVEERRVPQGAAAGDFLSPTQPFSPDMPAFDNSVMSEATMWGATPLDQLWCRIRFRQARYDGPMTPPGVRPILSHPGFIGGINWGSVSIDPERKLMAVNYVRVANEMRLVPRSEVPDLKPTRNGEIAPGAPVPQIGTPFAIESHAFLSPLVMPCTMPPFGRIAVVDLNTRKVKWDRPLGTSADSGPLGIATRLPLPMGVPNAGGSLTTRGRLLFIGATQERAFRAFDIDTGKKLWSAPLPFGGIATPMSYVSPRSGRQFVVIAAGGSGSLASPVGDAIVAFALPERRRRR